MEMKKSILLLTGSALLLAGCAKVENEVVVPESTMKHVVLKATVNEADTRVSADAAGSFSWQAGDEIAVYTDKGSVAKFTAANGGATADFEGDLPSDAGFGSYAFYPYADNFAAPSPDDHIVFTLGGVHNFVQDATNMPMMGAITDEGVTFEAVGGVLKLIVYNVPQGANEFRFVSTGGKKIAGNFTVTNGAIVTEDAVGAVEDTQKFLFQRPESGNMVFYIPLPTGTIGAFKVQFYEEDNNTPVYEKTANANLTVGLNKLIVAPALNVGGAVVADATLTNADIVAAGLAEQYPNSPVSYTNSFGTWKLAAITPNKDTKYLSIRNSSPLSYVELPSFPNDIASVTLHGVVNGSERAYSGSVYFRTVASNTGESLATGTASSAGADVVLTIPAGHKTGFIMSSNPCLMTGITVKFNAGTPATIPVISFTGTNSRTVGAGKLNCNIEGVKLSNALDNLGITPVIDAEADWITSAVITGDLTSENGATLTISAGSYNYGSEAKTGKVYLRATGAEEKVITVSQNPSIVNNPTLTATSGNASFTVTWTGDTKVANYIGYYSINELDDPTTGTALSISHDGSSYSASPSAAVQNGQTYHIYVRVNALTESYVGKYAIAEGWATTDVTPAIPQVEKTATLSIGSGDTFRTTSPATKKDNQNFTWTLTTSGYLGGWNADYNGQQIGKGGAAATATIASDYGDRTVTKVSVKASTGSSATISVKVGDTSFTCNGSNTASVSSNSPKWFTFEGTGTGSITITFAGGGSKASYYGGHVVTYSEVL